MKITRGISQNQQQLLKEAEAARAVEARAVKATQLAKAYQEYLKGRGDKERAPRGLVSTIHVKYQDWFSKKDLENYIFKHFVLGVNQENESNNLPEPPPKKVGRPLGSSNKAKQDKQQLQKEAMDMATAKLAAAQASSSTRVSKGTWDTIILEVQEALHAKGIVDISKLSFDTARKRLQRNNPVPQNISPLAYQEIP